MIQLTRFDKVALIIWMHVFDVVQRSTFKKYLRFYTSACKLQLQSLRDWCTKAVYVDPKKTVTVSPFQKEAVISFTL